MPLPVLILIAVTTLLAGSALALNWDDIVVALKGKKLAILGARGVGKTHLLKFLSTGSIPYEYKQTVAPEKVSSRRFFLRDIDLKVKETLDVSGDKAAYSEWKSLHDEADIVFYLLRADKILVGDAATETRIRDDMRHIGEWLEARARRPKFFIIGTHCDLDPSFSTISNETKGAYVDKFNKLPMVSELLLRAGGAKNVKIVLGSMRTTADTEALVYEIFRQVAA